MSDERRQRYAAAIWAALPDVLPYRYDTEVAADAAMAVADEELVHSARVGSVLQAGQITRLREENARLRAELDTALTALDRYKSGHHN